MTVTVSNQVFGHFLGNSELMGTSAGTAARKKAREQRKWESPVADKLQIDKEHLSRSRSAEQDPNQPPWLLTLIPPFIPFVLFTLHLYQTLNQPFFMALISEWKPGRKDWKERTGNGEK